MAYGLTLKSVFCKPRYFPLACIIHQFNSINGINSFTIYSYEFFAVYLN